jgi:hypothetical protein
LLEQANYVTDWHKKQQLSTLQSKLQKTAMDQKNLPSALSFATQFSKPLSIFK